MRSSIILLLVAAYFISGSIFSQEKDPFSSLLPEEEELKLPEPGHQGQVRTLDLDELNVEGIFWGVEIPQAIINGEIYKEKETIREIDAEIIKIEKGAVKVLYDGKVYVLSVEKKIE